MIQPKPPTLNAHCPPPHPHPMLLSSRETTASHSWLQTTCTCWTDRKHQAGRSVMISSESDRVSPFCCCCCSLHWLSAASTCLLLLSVVSGTGPEFWTIYPLLDTFLLLLTPDCVKSPRSKLRERKSDQDAVLFNYGK